MNYQRNVSVLDFEFPSSRVPSILLPWAHRNAGTGTQKNRITNFEGDWVETGKGDGGQGMRVGLGKIKHANLGGGRGYRHRQGR